MALIYPVILCGGAGTRLWPLSRRSMPKQFLNLTGKDSLFQQAVSRVSGADFAAPVVITANDYRFIAAQQLTDIGIKSLLCCSNLCQRIRPSHISSGSTFDRDPDAVMLVVPSDHYIPDATPLKKGG